MTPDQEVHLHEIRTRFWDEVSKKYKKGQEEHGGNLWEKDCLPALGEEAVDFIVYLHVVRENVSKIREVVVFLSRLKEHLSTFHPNHQVIYRLIGQLEELTFLTTPNHEFKPVASSGLSPANENADKSNPNIS